MIFTKSTDITLELPSAAVEAIFDECDRYDADETGGRILGTAKSAGRRLGISVSGVIEPGPNAKRTATYFKQDGEYQETVFREVEDRVPTIEHLGNWHTHHVNGLQHLSGGDVETYRRTVEHAKHNIDFFYALLVVKKNVGKAGLQRYSFKNYVMRRGDTNIYEIPTSAVSLVDTPLVWPIVEGVSSAPHSAQSIEAYQRSNDAAANLDLVRDQEIILQFFPKVKMLQSKELGIYWRGPIILADGSEQEVVVLRDAEAPFECGVNLLEPAALLEPVLKPLDKATFPRASAALIAAERACNAQLVASLTPKKRKGRLWMF